MKILRKIILGTFVLILWNILSKYIGFESTVILALATIYGTLEH